MESNLKFSGRLKMKVIRGTTKNLPWRIRNGLRPAFWLGWLAVQFAKLLSFVTGIPTLTSKLSLVKFTADGKIQNLGTVAFRVVTTAGVGFIVDAFQNIVELENMKYHGLGTNAAAEAVGDTALGAELTTQYSTDNTRATGTTVEGATANIYRTVATNTVDAAAAITEHGVFSQAATGGGVLLDRSVFAAVNLANGDSLQTTYEFTCNAGG